MEVHAGIGKLQVCFFGFATSLVVRQLSTILLGILFSVSFNITLWLGISEIYLIWWNFFGRVISVDIAIILSISNRDLADEKFTLRYSNVFAR